MTRRPHLLSSPTLFGVLVTALLVPSVLAADGAARSRPDTSSSSASKTGSSSSPTRVERSAPSRAASTRPAPASSDRQPVRTTRDRRYDARRHGYPYYGSWSWYRHGWYPLGYGAFWWGGWGWWGPSVVVVRDGGGYAYRGEAGWGALDTDVHPEEAEVWVDGERLGIADNFDGFPEYLWLPEGDYEVVIYHPGYRTIHREYTIRHGVVIEVDDRMDRGEAESPIAIFERETPRRDARIERDQIRRERVDRERTEEPWRRRDAAAPGTAPPPPETAQDWRDRDRAATRAVRVGQGEGRVRLTVEPSDASVYLNGSFLGLAEEWAEFLVEPGAYRLDFVRPGFESEVEEIDVDAGSVVDVTVRLDED